MYPSTSSGLLSASAAVAARPAIVQSVTVVPAAADATVVLYDNASAASGTVLAKVFALANGASVSIAFNHPIQASNGIYLDISGASAAAIVTYSLM